MIYLHENRPATARRHTWSAYAQTDRDGGAVMLLSAALPLVRAQTAAPPPRSNPVIKLLEGGSPLSRSGRTTSAWATTVTQP